MESILFIYIIYIYSYYLSYESRIHDCRPCVLFMQVEGDQILLDFGAAWRARFGARRSMWLARPTCPRAREDYQFCPNEPVCKNCHFHNYQTTLLARLPSRLAL